jgi:hypothetical protein
MCARLGSVLCLLVAGWMIVVARPVQAEVDVTIDHYQLTQNPSGLIKMKRGEALLLHIVNTNVKCFEFNQSSIERTSPSAQQRSMQGSLHPDNVDLTIIHDGLPRDYVIEAINRPGVAGSCSDLEPHRWTVSVESGEWDLAFAGAFTADRLVDPAFSLDAGTMTSASGTVTQGFYVHRNGSWTLGAAAMVHIYHTDPERLTGSFLKRWSINWVPVSFGLGINGTDSNTRYFFGTGLRFDTKLFLIGGVALGSVSRLPNGLQEGGFTTNPNALTGLTKRTGGAVFVGLSYSFLNTGVAPFQSRIQSNPPLPQTPLPPALTISAPSATGAGTCTVTVANGGSTDANGATVDLDVAQGESATVKTWTCTGTGCTKPNGSGAISGLPLTLPAKASVNLTIALDKTAKISATAKASGFTSGTVSGQQCGQ